MNNLDERELLLEILKLLQKIDRKLTKPRTPKKKT